MSNLLNHAEKELRISGMLKDKSEPETIDDEYNNEVSKCVLEMVKVFSEQNHSGHSAGMVISILNRVLRFETLTALTGLDDEWMEVGENLYQNNRCPSVFKENGISYDLNGRIFYIEEEDNISFTSNKSKVDIKFPYYPPENPEKVYFKTRAEYENY